MSTAEESVKRYELRLKELWKSEAAPAELRDYEQRLWQYLRKSWNQRDWSHSWDEHGLGELGAKRIFEAYFDIREMRLDAGRWTEGQYAAVGKEVSSELTSPELKFYNALKAKLEQLVPEPQWKKDEEAKPAEAGPSEAVGSVA
ncbi:MAG: hypothetical protein QW548_00825 [Candidatus Aenigmatarchaeota archaeon]